MHLLAVAVVLLSSLTAFPHHPDPEVPASTSGKKQTKPAAGSELAIAPPGLRLPRHLLPESNRVHLKLDPAQETFSGRIEMEARASQPLRNFWLHAERLEIQEAKVTAGGETWALEVLPPSKGIVGFRSEREIPAGAATVTIAYTGRLDDSDTLGIFRQKEGDDWYLFTQFEPLGARRAFPCFDEPDSKVPWQVTLDVPAGLSAVANTPAVSLERTAAGGTVIDFATTRPLPSYLVAFAVGPFDIVKAGTTRKGVPVRIVVPEGRGKDVQYVAENTAPILAILEDYFGIPYPYDKLDLMAIPLTVGFGAMENPGLVTFNQRLLVARPEDFSLSFQRSFGSVMAHELAHQWFGDLVTLAWWDDLWLNEAFASWMGDKTVQQWKPEWSGGVSTVTRRSGALNADSLRTARRIRQPIVSDHDIENAFDGITYSKGASVIAMFEQWVGESAFRDGIRAYLAGHADKNATAADFLAAIGKAAGRDVSAPFTTFLDQVGSPLISFDLSCPEGGPPRLKLTQERYLPLGSEAKSDATWNLPVCVSYPTGGALKKECTLLGGKSTTLDLASAGSCPAWIAPNSGGLGYYRSVLPGPQLTALLRDGMGMLTLPERVAIIGDVNALLAAGKVDAALALDLVQRLSGDENRHVVSAIAAVASGVENAVSDTMRPQYARFIRAMFGERARRLGWKADTDEDDDTRLLRASLLDLVTGKGEDAELAREGRSLALAWLADPAAVDPDLVSVSLEAAARAGDRDLFDRYVEAAGKAEDRRDRQRLLGALGAFRDPALLGQALDLVISDAFDIRESSGILFNGLEDPASRRLVYEFVKAKLDALLARMPEQAAPRMASVCSAQCDASLEPEMNAVFKERWASLPGGPRRFDQAMEQLDLCARRRAAQGPSVAEFLARF